jgi:anti-sigma regulatory factor (Ser/Thr protein kinase)
MGRRAVRMEAPDRLVLNLRTSTVSPRVARDAVRRYADDHGIDGPVVQAALLITSELVSNAVLHGEAPITLRVKRLDDGALRVEVCDASTDTEPIRDVDPSELATTGRGLTIVSQLARDWRVEFRGDSRSVVADIAVL